MLVGLSLAREQPQRADDVLDIAMPHCPFSASRYARPYPELPAVIDVRNREPAARQYWILQVERRAACGCRAPVADDNERRPLAAGASKSLLRGG